MEQILTEAGQAAVSVVDGAGAAGPPRAAAVTPWASSSRFLPPKNTSFMYHRAQF